MHIEQGVCCIDVSPGAVRPSAKTHYGVFCHRSNVWLDVVMQQFHSGIHFPSFWIFPISCRRLKMVRCVLLVAALQALFAFVLNSQRAVVPNHRCRLSEDLQGVVEQTEIAAFKSSLKVHRTIQQLRRERDRLIYALLQHFFLVGIPKEYDAILPLIFWVEPSAKLNVIFNSYIISTHHLDAPKRVGK